MDPDGSLRRRQPVSIWRRFPRARTWWRRPARRRRGQACSCTWWVCQTTLTCWGWKPDLYRLRIQLWPPQRNSVTRPNGWRKWFLRSEARGEAMGCLQYRTAVLHPPGGSTHRSLRSFLAQLIPGRLPSVRGGHRALDSSIRGGRAIVRRPSRTDPLLALQALVPEVSSLVEAPHAALEAQDVKPPT